MTGEPAFEVLVGGRHYRIWANGRTDGFGDGNQTVLIINRIPLIIGRVSDDGQIAEGLPHHEVRQG